MNLYNIQVKLRLRIQLIFHESFPHHSYGLCESNHQEFIQIFIIRKE